MQFLWGSLALTDFTFFRKLKCPNDSGSYYQQCKLGNRILTSMFVYSILMHPVSVKYTIFFILDVRNHNYFECHTDM